MEEWVALKRQKWTLLPKGLIVLASTHTFDRLSSSIEIFCESLLVRFTPCKIHHHHVHVGGGVLGDLNLRC